MKDPIKVARGKKSRRTGADTERRTRADLEKEGWIVSKWQNNIKDNKCVGAKQGRFRMTSTGFPDFIAYKRVACWNCQAHEFLECSYEIVFVECKTNGKISKEEKEKAQWYLTNGYCDKFYIAYRVKDKNKIKIEYKQVEENESKRKHNKRI